MSIEIRRAVKEDCPRLLELVKELAVYEKAPEEVTVTLDHFTESGFGLNPVWWAFVAEEDGNVEGFALYYVRYSTWKGQRMYLEDLIVTEKMRGRGLGKLLFDRLLEEVKDKNSAAWYGRCWTGMNPLLIFTKKYNARFDAGWMNCAIDV